MKATFENSVNVLVKAYFDGYLERMSCAACAVGNLVACGMGYTFRNAWNWNEADEKWQDVIVSTQLIYLSDYKGLAKQQIDSTGYTPKQLARIEKAFMGRGDGEPFDNFDGLMAVVDVLADIHGIDLSLFLLEVFGFGLGP